MKINSSVLRFGAGLLVIALAAAVLLFSGIGTLRESWYAAEYPSLYADLGYGFWTAVIAFGIVVYAWAALVLLLLGRLASWIGNRLFRPKE